MIGEQSANRRRGIHYAWIVAGMTCLALLAVGGVRSSFGVFVHPLQHEFGWDRGAISVTAVLSMLLYGALVRIIREHDSRILRK